MGDWYTGSGMRPEREEKIPTAEEFLEMNPFASYWYDEKNKTTVCRSDEVKTIMIEFAKLHRKPALKAASEKATVSMRHTRPFSEKRPVVDKESISSAYPESNIV